VRGERVSRSTAVDAKATVGTLWSGVIARASVVAVLAASLVALGVTGHTPAVAAAKPKPPPVEYYLALGDSMAAGTGATTPSDDYVNVVYQHELARYPGLQVVNLACGGATTGSVVDGPGCSYASGTQLGDAEAFLAAHAGRVAMVTIDIGANNVDGCLNSSGISMSCVTSGLSQITTYLPQILDGLRASYPGVAIYGMDYYDPFLDQWLTGASGQAVATQSEALAVELNSLLGQLYGADDAAMADPATLFETSDFALTGTYNGSTVPENVALICAWTLMCSANDIHPNDAGHAEVADAFEQVIDQVTVTTTGLADGAVKSPYSVQLTASGGHPPYRWSLVRGAGSLPPGLRLHGSTGVISGKPTTSGSYTFTVQVKDTKLKVRPTTRDTATAVESITVH
jgi:lysophospholipase L1-like esterase